ncbi:MAG TPA: sugar phosphate isomerase/epimerase [Phycisphaerales bacterium]|nr:sugar phosphate isomerase/epimerase [Phycisphaerales bacterium]
MQRREFIGAGAAASLHALIGTPARATTSPEAQPETPAPARPYQGGRSPWPICLDTATIRPATLLDKIRIASAAGYDAIEPWEGELDEHERSGGDLKELGKRIRDAGLRVPSVIGLWDAIPPTREEFDRSLEASRRRMRQAADIGSEHIQTIPQPARPWREFDPAWAAACYRELLEIGLGEFGISSAMVFVQFLEGARTMGQAAQIALDADHPHAKIIPDVFHMHIGGSGFNGLRRIRGEFIAIFQCNDAPSTPARAELKDEHRVYPGEGVLPLRDCFRDLAAIGYRGCVSLELYNPAYWAQDHAVVARTGLERLVSQIELALGA